MKKRSICLLLVLMICFGWLRMECAASGIDPAQPCSLTLFYTKSEDVFSELKIDIYRVADLHPNGVYRLLEPFSNYPIKIHGITSQQEWWETAQTVRNYVEANQIEAYQSQYTDQNGKAVFTDLETGIYMVKGTTAQSNDSMVVFHDFMIYLPTPVGNDYDYSVEAKPKCTQYELPTKYTVVKLWKDSDYSAERPNFVFVDIIKDGEVQNSVVLNSENNWSYSWEATDKDSSWSVIEKDVPDGYQVSISNNQSMFIITNSKTPVVPDDPDTPNTPDAPNVPDTPETGDTSPLLLYGVGLCISGFGLILLWELKLRERRDEKKQ